MISIAIIEIKSTLKTPPKMSTTTQPLPLLPDELWRYVNRLRRLSLLRDAIRQASEHRDYRVRVFKLCLSARLKNETAPWARLRSHVMYQMALRLLAKAEDRVLLLKSKLRGLTEGC